MQCPSCGLAIPTEQGEVCPACGRAVPRAVAGGAEPAESAPLAQQPAMDPAAAAPAEPAAVAGPSAIEATAPAPAAPPQPGTPQGVAGYPWPGYGQPVPAPYAPGTPQGYPLMGTQPGYPPMGAQPGYPAPGTPPGYPPPGAQPGYPPPGAQPGYPPPGAQPGYPAGYPWAAPATTPVAPWGAAPGWYAPAAPMAPPPPARKRRTGLLVGSIIGVVLIVCASAVALLYVAGTHIPAPTSGTSVSNPATQAAATATASGQVVYQNSFAAQAAEWADDGARCFFRADGYHVANDTICFAPAGEEAAVDVSVDIKQVSGPVTHPYGIVIRAAEGAGTHYYVDIDSNSKWTFGKCVSKNCSVLVDYTPNPAIQAGLNTVNTLEVRGIGGHFDIFINGTKVGQVDDSTLSTGYVGLEAGSNIECVFTNLTIRRLG